MNLGCVLPLSKLPNCLVPVTFPGSFCFLQNHHANPRKSSGDFRSYKDGNVVMRKGGTGNVVMRKGGTVRGWLLPVDPWAPKIDSENIASQLFAVSLFPYVGFLYFITKSMSAPKLTLLASTSCLPLSGLPSQREYMTAKVKYGTSLSNVDWLHGGAESLLTLTNLFIVLGLRQALRKTEDAKESTSSSLAEMKKPEKPYM